MAWNKITKFRETFIREAEERARLYELAYHGCAEMVLTPIQELLGIEDANLRMVSSCITGGLGRTGKTCGALLGGIMALGLKYGRSDPEVGMEGLMKGHRAAYDLVKWFEQEFGSTDCRGLTGYDFTDDEVTQKFIDGPEFERVCVNVVAGTARRVAEMWDEEPKGW